MNKGFLQLILTLLPLIILCSCEMQNDQAPENLQYPIAKKENHKDTLHGTYIVSDPYRWMEDMQSTETINWVKEEDSLMRSYLYNTPGFNKVKSRITSLTGYDTYSVPQQENGISFFTKTEKDSSSADLYMQKGSQASPVKILDHTMLPEKEKQLRTLGSFPGYFASPKADLVFIAMANSNQSRWIHGKIIRTNGEILKDDITGLNVFGGNIVWSRDNLGFFYNRYTVPAEKDELTVSPVNPKIYYHKTGTAQSEDRIIYQASDAKKSVLTIYVSHDNRFLIIEERMGSKVENTVLLKDLNNLSSPVRPFFPKADANYSYLGNKGNQLFFYTNRRAPKGKIIAVQSDDPSIIKEIVSEGDESIMGGSAVGGNILGYFGQYFAIGYVNGGLTSLKIFDNNGQLKQKTDIPIDGAIWGGLSGNEETPEFYYQFLGIVAPCTIYKYSIAEKQRSVFKEAKIPFAVSEYETKQVFYKSKDGTEIPMFVTHKKGLQLNGKNPVFMYGYGAFNWISFLWYQQHLLLWLEMGGVYAQPSIRGGGEYGEQWHQAGIGKNRQNAIDDYNAAAEWLIRTKYTSNSLMVANGGSASAGLAAMAFLQRPELYGAVVIDRAVFDFVRYHKFTTAAAWVQEFGSPDKKEDFETLYRLSPYHRVDSTICYPPVLLMQGDNDQVAAPFHSYKFLAKLQEANQKCDHPVLLKMMWNTGHTFGSTPEKIIDARTSEIMFLIKTLHLPINNIGQK